MPPMLSRDQVRRIDQLAVERYGIPSVILMENAGRGAAEIIEQHYGPKGKALILCGTGNNGGDGCVIARHLHILGWRVSIVVVGDEERMSPDMRTNYNIARKMDIPKHEHDRLLGTTKVRDDPTEGSVVVDALLGTGFQGIVREPLASLICSFNNAPRRAMVAIDVPSGLDCDSGVPSNATIRADRTITFVALKRGFAAPQAQSFLGTVHLVSIGAPCEL